MAVCSHGGIDYAELEMLGITPEEVIDFSANLNPFGPPAEIMEAINQGHYQLSQIISHYPDSQTTHLRRCLAQKLGVKVDNILVGNGCTELIRLAALAYFSKGDQVLIIEPTFGEYQVACQIAGASIVRQRLSAENAFQLNVDDTIQLIQSLRAKQSNLKGIFIANPNNPTGRYLPQTEFEKVLHASHDCLVILDEAYVNFVDSAWSSLDMTEGSNLLVLRSMTKDYAMAGLRLGYAAAREEIIANLRRICPPWNVNALAQKAGISAIANKEYLRRCQVELKEAKDYLVVELSRLGFSPVPSEANFFLVEVGDAAEFRHKLLRRKILVRDCTSFGLPGYVRIAPRTLPECQRLVTAIEEIRTGGQNAS